ncbi:Uncharacterised protein [Mycobacteroides abscessus subsp. abscessus]|nr:Uncharacterised protein [Mycobacteroides abscessus]SHY37839.1 Uncharacterised protein [Mycobacteroides abscessus subsp. abscessus]CPT40229.1 Uncharacterised protein [Mycobacteroides abscessus]CPU48832.1 Uncharacterised protein [Mycobacteroides abscessus]CPV19524.1 Uncharacterised protein [Mycobacteroides abscessus]
MLISSIPTPSIDEIESSPEPSSGLLLHSTSVRRPSPLPWLVSIGISHRYQPSSIPSHNSELYPLTTTPASAAKHADASSLCAASDRISTRYSPPLLMPLSTMYGGST